MKKKKRRPMEHIRRPHRRKGKPIRGTIVNKGIRYPTRQKKRPISQSHAIRSNYLEKILEKINKPAKRIEELEDKDVAIFVSHQNRDEAKTQRAHQYAKYIEEYSDFKVNIDFKFFPKEQVTNIARINEIISKEMRESDIFLALYHLVEESNRYERSMWYKLEARKAKYRGKPIIHAFLDGSRDSGVVESKKCYKIHYKKGEHWKADLLEKIQEIVKKHKKE